MKGTGWDITHCVFRCESRKYNLWVSRSRQRHHVSGDLVTTTPWPWMSKEVRHDSDKHRRKMSEVFFETDFASRELPEPCPSTGA